jgi:sec-independent protein translocase protein TatB
MFDIGWTELLVIAVVLIVVVGPKDLPPMLRAFGKMTANFRKMAGEFRTQFDEALRESEMDDVRKTISDAQRLNPTNALRDAINPLRQMGQEIKSDLQKATELPKPMESNPTGASSTDIEAQHVIEGAEPVSATPEVPESVEPTAKSVSAVSTPTPSPATAGTPVSEPGPVAAAPVAASASVSAATSAPAQQPPAAQAKAARTTAAKATKATKTTATAEMPSAVPAKPKRSRAAPKTAEDTAAVAPKAAPRKRTAKKTDTPKDEA